MKLLLSLCFLIFIAVASASAAAITYTGVSVSCKETTHALTTETLSIVFDNTANGGKISGGAIGSNSCAFQLTNHVVFPSFVNGSYAYNASVIGNQDVVCWASAFCNVADTNDSLVVSDASLAGSLFTITAGSIITTFTISPAISAVPEPGELFLAGAGLLAIGGFLRRRRNPAF